MIKKLLLICSCFFLVSCSKNDPGIPQIPDTEPPAQSKYVAPAAKARVKTIHHWNSITNSPGDLFLETFYAANDRISKIQYESAFLIPVYDAEGRISSSTQTATDGSVTEKTYKYDSRNFLASTSTKNSGALALQEISNEYIILAYDNNFKITKTRSTIVRPSGTLTWESNLTWSNGNLMTTEHTLATVYSPRQLTYDTQLNPYVNSGEDFRVLYNAGDSSPNNPLTQDLPGVSTTVSSAVYTYNSGGFPLIRTGANVKGPRTGFAFTYK